MVATQTPPDVIGQSKIFLDALDHASRAAMIDRPMLVTGERGAGKALFAARIHFLSPRWEGPLVRLSCSAAGEAQLSADLFGGDTGGPRRVKGAIERAEGGTLILADIAAAPLSIQERLLRLLERGEYERAGDEESRNADIRIIASAREDLRRLTHEGTFRADLLDRLAFDVVAVPPLRDRQDDILLLAAQFGGLAIAELGLKFPGFSPEAAIALKAHAWPGNVRELRNAAERAAFHWGEGAASGLISEIILDPFERAFGRFDVAKAAKSLRPQQSINLVHPDSGEGVHDLRAYLGELEKSIVEDALAKNGGNQKRAGDALSLTYDQIRGIIKKHGLAA